ncbi:MAG: YebC/PmpR family DNA-binding transcriptional regulator [Patescibacteria group bacterium]
MADFFIHHNRSAVMSGHSKWSTIKRQKGVTDSRRSAVFTKLGRLITVAARLGGSDPAMNFRLRLAIDKAKSANLPNDNIERAVKSGTGADKDTQTKDVLYEGFGPGGAAILVEAVTDNGNRTAAEVRRVFVKYGGSLGAQHSVGWMFARRGVMRVPLASVPPARRQELELALIDAGAEDVGEADAQLVITAAPDRLARVSRAVADRRFSAEIDVEYVPTTITTIAGAAQTKLYDLLEALDELDDVTRITCNET